MTVPISAARRPNVLADFIPSRAMRNVPAELVRDISLIVGGAAFVGILAQIAIPIPGTPVPVTGQTFGVLVVGAALGWWRALASMSMYLLAGVAGLPWFAEAKSGLEWPTFGYVVGFLLAAVVVGSMAGRGGDRTVAKSVATMALGTLAIYSVGVPWLAANMGLNMSAAIDAGLTPFLLGDGLKIALAAGLLPGLWKFAESLERKN
ncbi:MAG: biotin transporter BioY [Corynebacteriales bacterium]|nr:biotin transporter BioY [Mycobacteriales bacterium]